MRILLDECIDKRLAGELPDYDVGTVSGLGWSSIKDGELLNRAQSEFDVLLTVDQNLPYQQHLPKYTIAVVILRASSNRLMDLKPLVPSLQVLPAAPIGEATIVDDQ